MARLGALGTLVWDRIRHPARGEVVEQWGGLTYSLSALSAACPPGWVVEPLVKVGDDLVAPARDFLAHLPSVVLETGFRTVDACTNRVELTYIDSAHRGERLTGGVPAWEWLEIEPLLERFDALYLNFVSGFEMDLQTARRVRERFPGPIYADLHSLFLGCPGSGTRQQRALPEWEDWVSCFDAVQLNDQELKLLAGARPVAPFAAELLDRGPSMVVVTMGGAGARIEARAGALWSGGDGEGLSLHVPVAAGELDGDPTGCGDVWGSAYLMSLLAGLAPEQAAERAHEFAAQNIRTAGTDELNGQLRRLLHPTARA